MTAPPPVLLLDVDGVLNALRRDLPEGWRRGTFHGYVLSWDPSVVARLREWHDSGRVELQWLTTWTELADQLLAEPMGLPRGLRTHSRDVLPTGFGGPLGALTGWWKLAAAREVAEAEPGRRIVWIDDDLADQAEDTSEWLAASGQVLVVAPDHVLGLTHAELDRVEAWLGSAGGEDEGAHRKPPYDEPPTPT
ncbi:HAD domain-containing protein [Blastococcus sp. SYSU DS0619]